jgi:lysine 6-dehydrogenase
VQLKAFSDLGMFELKPVQIDGREVVPRDLFNHLFEPQVRVDDVKDVCIVGAHAKGKKNGKLAEAVIEVIDYYDESTGFTAIQRMTGWHISIIATMMAKHEIPAGSIPLELAIPGEAFVREARKRGFRITEHCSSAEGIAESELVSIG